MANPYPNFADIDRERKENKENFEKNVPQSLLSDYLDLVEQLKQNAPKRQGELNRIHQKYDIERTLLHKKAQACLEKMSELTGISTWDLQTTNLVGGYYFND